MQYKIYQEGHDCRDFILYLCPVGELQAQLSLFWQKSKVMRRNDLRFTIYDDKNNDNDSDDYSRWKLLQPILKQKSENDAKDSDVDDNENSDDIDDNDDV